MHFPAKIILLTKSAKSVAIYSQGKALCKVNAVFRYVNAFSDWMSLGLIAFSRCLNLTHPQVMETVSTRTLVVAAVAANVIYSLALIAPTMAGVTI